MATDTNVEIFRRLLEAFNNEGVEGVLSYFDDDVEVYDPDARCRGNQLVRPPDRQRPG